MMDPIHAGGKRVAEAKDGREARRWHWPVDLDREGSWRSIINLVNRRNFLMASAATAAAVPPALPQTRTPGIKALKVTGCRIYIVKISARYPILVHLLTGHGVPAVGEAA